MAESKSVLITGASTGIGRATAVRLAKSGWRVFAGVRRAEDGDSLQTEVPAITPVTIDVSNRSEVTQLAQKLDSELGPAGLDGVVNNAGFSASGPVEFVDLDDLRRQFEVNYFGVVSVTQAFLPLLRRARGRVVCVGSIGGRVPVPFLSPYSSSKAAVSALCDCLRLELRPWGIEVSLIEPGAVKTPIWDKGHQYSAERLQSAPPEVFSLYGPAVMAMRKVAESTAAQGIAPDEVALTIQHALTASKPRTRYIVGREAKIQALVRRLPDRMRDSMLASHIGLPQGAPTTD